MRLSPSHAQRRWRATSCDHRLIRSRRDERLECEHFGVPRRRRSRDRAALYAARPAVFVSAGSGRPWRERPRSARLLLSPARPERSLTPWLSVSRAGVRPCATARRPFQARRRRSHARICARSSRTIRSRMVPDSWLPLGTLRPLNDERHPPAALHQEELRAFASRLAGQVGPVRWRPPSRTHAGAVLGTVQGSSLCSDRADARPSGLDGACAQLLNWQLRDGRRRVAAWPPTAVNQRPASTTGCRESARWLRSTRHDTPAGHARARRGIRATTGLPERGADSVRQSAHSQQPRHLRLLRIGNAVPERVPVSTVVVRKGKLLGQQVVKRFSGPNASPNAGDVNLPFATHGRWLPG
jgi:hypothetical protein